MEKPSDIARVTQRIESVLRAFCATPRQFHMIDLNRYVESNVGPVAPDSPARILRALRRARKVRYIVLDRAGSLYAILPATPTQTSFAEFLEPRAEEHPD